MVILENILVLSQMECFLQCNLEIPKRNSNLMLSFWGLIWSHQAKRRTQNCEWAAAGYGGKSYVN